jgi:hypothetical protein
MGDRCGRVGEVVHKHDDRVESAGSDWRSGEKCRDGESAGHAINLPKQIPPIGPYPVGADGDYYSNVPAQTHDSIIARLSRNSRVLLEKLNPDLRRKAREGKETKGKGFGA